MCEIILVRRITHWQTKPNLINWLSTKSKLNGVKGCGADCTNQRRTH